jgi:hypothetical protein
MGKPLVNDKISNFEQATPAISAGVLVYYIIEVRG